MEEGKLGRPLAIAAGRRSAVAAAVRAEPPSSLAAGRRSTSSVVFVGTVSNVPEESVSVEEGSEVFVEAQGKSHRSQITL
uniref:Uncharacterized protein n=1 Tax=Oryza sativa subsp. japonica TaxID=39947 RepID=Q5Z550_ORYSJ|nr:hypothetical protein [Oryza sativa Japonica Group]